MYDSVSELEDHLDRAGRVSHHRRHRGTNRWERCWWAVSKLCFRAIHAI